MAQLIPIIADVPSTNPGLGFPEYADALANAIRGGEPPQFTIGLYGTWGSGKSSLLNAVNRDLSKKGSNVIPVLFDAWRYERSEHILVPLLHKIYAEAKKYGDKSITSYLNRALRSIVYSLSFNLSAVGLGIDMKSVKESWDEQGLVPLDQAFSKPFEELQKLPEALKGRRIAVLIDDLDRCSPENVVSVLESINLVMDVPGFIFLLALDYDVLIKAVVQQYPHVSGHVFIQKMIQLPFRVPPLNVDSPGFLEELIPELSNMVSIFPRGFADYVRDIAIFGLKANPRQIKRLINSYLLLRHVIEQRELVINDQLLSALIGLQLRWPSQYQDFQDSVLAEDKNPLQNLIADKDEPDLQKYAELFLTEKVKSIDLRQILQLTAVVAIEETGPDITSLSESRELLLRKFADDLKKRGFEVSPRSDRLYYNPKIPNSRFLIGKRVVRLEKRTRTSWGRPWQLVKSFSITRETHLALKAADKLISSN